MLVLFTIALTAALLWAVWAIVAWWEHRHEPEE